MRIGIDARFLTHPQAGGFKTYTINLIRSLGQIDCKNEYVIYIDRQPVPNTLPEFANLKFCVVPLALPYLGTAIREQVQLPRQIWKDDLDLVHFPCNTAPINLEQKYVLTLHDTIQLSSKGLFSAGLSPAGVKDQAIKNYSKWAIRKSASKAERIITVSNYEKKKIANQLGIIEDHIDVTHLAVDPIFKPADSAIKKIWRQELNCEMNLPSRYIMGIGYEPRKNIALVIQAFALLAPTIPDLGLVLIVAQNQARQKYQNLARELALNDRISVLQSLPSCQLVKLYNLADVFVFPSERESFGLPPMEALACGTPTVAMKGSSLPEVLGNGALLIDGQDQEKWADAIFQLLTDSRTRDDLRSRGLMQAAQQTWQKCANMTIQVYNSVLEPARTS